MGIRAKLLMWLAVVILPIAGASFFAVKVIDARLSERIEADLANARRLEATRIKEVLESYKRDAENLISGNHIKEFFGDLHAYRSGEILPDTIIGGEGGFSIVDPNAILPLQELALGLQHKAALMGTEVVELKLVDRSGGTLGQTHGFGWEPYDPTLIEWSMDTSEMLFGNAFRPTDGEDRLGSVSPIYNGLGTVVGALVMEMRLGPVVDLAVKHEGFARTREAHIAQLNPDGDAEFITLLRFKRDAAFNKVVAAGKRWPINLSLESPDGQVLRAKDYRKIDSILAIETIQETGWGLVIKIDSAEAFGPVSEVQRVVIIAGLVTVSVVIFGWIMFLHPLANRLQRAARAAERVASGDYKSPIGDWNTDEIGNMARSIDQLATDLDADIQMRAAAEDRLIHQAMHDELTGLFNRKHANEIIRVLSAADATGNASIMFLDLDGFKGINDMFGHAAGDEVLVAVARRLSGALDKAATLARWGGDEFVVILPDADHQGASKVAERISSLFNDPIATSSGAHALGCSIGLASSGPGRSLEDVLQEADALMYAEKQSRRSLRAVSSLAVRTVENALDENRVEVWYQPIVRARSNAQVQVVGAEALVRIRSSEGGIISPNDFIPDIKESPTGRALDQCVLSKSLEAHAQWRNAGMVSDDFRLSINMTGLSIRDPELVTELRSHITRLNLPPHTIVLEISEETDEIDIDLLNRVRALGVLIALDDVGLNRSNLDRLVSIDPDIAKIDRRWLSDSSGALRGGSKPNTDVVLPKLIDICQRLGMDIIAEGVESAEQHQLLNELGVAKFQGYLFDVPRPDANFVSRWRADIQGELFAPEPEFKVAG